MMVIIRLKLPVTLNKEKNFFPIMHLDRRDYQFWASPRKIGRKRITPSFGVFSILNGVGWYIE